MPIVTVEDAVGGDARGAGHRRGRRRPGCASARRRTNTATVTVEWDPEKVADHTGVTATFGAPAGARRSRWCRTPSSACAGPRCSRPSGPRSPTTGFPVVEGLLSLVHLDHAAHLLSAMPSAKTELTVTATASAAYRHRGRPRRPGHREHRRWRDSSLRCTVLATLEERFAIRGRTGRRRAGRSAARRGSDHRQRHRHPASSPPRRRRHRAGRHERVRGGLR